MNLSDTITKCNKVMNCLKERDSVVRIHSNNLTQIANNRPIINEETENISSSDDEEARDEKKD